MKAIKKWVIKKALVWVQDELEENLPAWESWLKAKAAKTDNPVDDVMVKEGARITRVYLPVIFEFLLEKWAR